MGCTVPTCQSTESIKSLHGIRIVCQVKLGLGLGLCGCQPGNLLRLLFQLRSSLPDQRSCPAIISRAAWTLYSRWDKATAFHCAVSYDQGAGALHHTVDGMKPVQGAL